MQGVAILFPLIINSASLKKRKMAFYLPKITV